MNAIVRSKTFRTANGLAVQLPESFGIGEGVEVELTDRGAGEIVLVPVRPPLEPAEWQARWKKMLEDMLALGPVGEIGVREPIEFPDRFGL